MHLHLYTLYILTIILMAEWYFPHNSYHLDKRPIDSWSVSKWYQAGCDKSKFENIKGKVSCSFLWKLTLWLCCHLSYCNQSLFPYFSVKTERVCSEDHHHVLWPKTFRSLAKGQNYMVQYCSLGLSHLILYFSYCPSLSPSPSLPLYHIVKINPMICCKKVAYDSHKLKSHRIRNLNKTSHNSWTDAKPLVR